MGFDVVAIDQEIAPEFAAELDQMNVPLVVGDGRLPVTMETAGLPNAEALIVATSNDHLNLEITMRARDLNPDIRIVVRMWDDKFAQQIRQFMRVEAVMSATDLAAPIFAGSAVGIEIAQTLTINGIDYSMIRLHVAPGSFLANTTIEATQRTYGMDIVLHERNGSVEVHPGHENMINAGDTLVVFAAHSKITELVARSRKR
jgi:voltage-gated potassium channel